MRKTVAAPGPTTTRHEPARNGAPSDGDRLPASRFRRHPIILAIIAAGAGIVTVLAGGFHYRCTLELAIAGAPGNESLLAQYRRELLELMPAASHIASETTTGWSVRTWPNRGSLRFTFLASSTVAGEGEITHLAESFAGRLASVANEARSTPGDAERVLAEQLDGFKAELSSLQPPAVSRLDTAPSDPSDPFAVRDAATASLTNSRNGYRIVRQKLDDLTSRLRTLQATPVSSLVKIDPAVRRAGLEADVELAQDLKTLKVHLVEIKSRLLEVAQAAAPRLEELAAAVEDLRRTGDTPAAQSATGAHRLAAENLMNTAKQYQRLLSDFSGAWDRELTSLRDDPTDPLVGEVIEVQSRLADLAGDLLFQTVEPLSAMKAQVDALAAEPRNAAGHYELISVSTRRFHRLRTAHHQFEFTASDVKTINNPRLDAAVRSARGLHKRSLERVRTIDERLQEEARRQAVEQRDREAADLTRRIEELRTQTDATVGVILAAQDRLVEASPKVDTHVRQQFTAQRTNELENRIASTRRRLNELAAARSSPLDPDAVTVTDRRVDRIPVNLAQRLASGWLVTATILVAALLARGRRTFFTSRARQETVPPT